MGSKHLRLVGPSGPGSAWVGLGRPGSAWVGLGRYGLLMFFDTHKFSRARQIDVAAAMQTFRAVQGESCFMAKCYTNDG